MKTRVLAMSIGLCFTLSLLSVGAFYLAASSGFTGFSLENTFTVSSDVPPEDVPPIDEQVKPEPVKNGTGVYVMPNKTHCSYSLD